MTEHHDTVKIGIDLLSLSTALGAFLGYLPPLAALASLIWSGIQIYEWWKKKQKRRI